MPRRSGAEYREVDVWIVAGGVLLACWIGFAGARRRAARREAETRSRARARRQRVPLVSANVRGQPVRKPDIWRDETESASQGKPRDA